MTPHPDAGLFERFEALPAGERERLLRHVAQCDACRQRLAAEDPSRMFALLAVDSLPAEALERLSASVNRELDRTAPRRAATRWIEVAASVAAALVLAGFFGVFVLRQSQPAPSTAPGAPPPTLPVAVAATEQETPAAGVELISSPGEAQVMELAIGETQVVMIFDEALDI